MFLLQGEQGNEVPASIGFDSLWFLFGGRRDCYGRCWYSMILEPFIGDAVCCTLSYKFLQSRPLVSFSHTNFLAAT